MSDMLTLSLPKAFNSEFHTGKELIGTDQWLSPRCLKQDNLWELFYSTNKHWTHIFKSEAFWLTLLMPLEIHESLTYQEEAQIVMIKQKRMNEFGEPLQW